VDAACDKDTEQELQNLEKDFDEVAANVKDGPRDEPKAPPRPKRPAGTAAGKTSTAAQKR
jgi:hypothetical protein